MSVVSRCDVLRSCRPAPSRSPQSPPASGDPLIASIRVTAPREDAKTATAVSRRGPARRPSRRRVGRGRPGSARSGPGRDSSAAVVTVLMSGRPREGSPPCGHRPVTVGAVAVGDVGAVAVPVPSCDLQDCSLHLLAGEQDRMAEDRATDDRDHRGRSLAPMTSPGDAEPGADHRGGDRGSDAGRHLGSLCQRPISVPQRPVRWLLEDQSDRGRRLLSCNGCGGAGRGSHLFSFLVGGAVVVN